MSQKKKQPGPRAKEIYEQLKRKFPRDLRIIEHTWKDDSTLKTMKELEVAEELIY